MGLALAQLLVPGQAMGPCLPKFGIVHFGGLVGPNTGTCLGLSISWDEVAFLGGINLEC